MKSSCLVRPENHKFFMLRDELVLVTGDHCAAALLALFEFWTNGRLAESSDDPDLWVPRSTRRLEQDLFGLYHRRKIGRAIKDLVTKGFLKLTTKPGFRRTPHYQLQTCELNHAIERLPTAPEWVKSLSGTKVFPLGPKRPTADPPRGHKKTHGGGPKRPTGPNKDRAREERKERSKKEVSQEADEDLERFMALYPRQLGGWMKGSYQAVRRRWARLAPDADLAAAIIDGLIRALWSDQWISCSIKRLGRPRGRHQQFIANGEAFVSGRQWERDWAPYPHELTEADILEIHGLDPKPIPPGGAT